MKILILAGGTGSIALQTGLYSVFEDNVISSKSIDIKVLTNCYDAGLSTGIVRKVFNGMILGPSDLRKNQATRLKLENPKSPWLKFLDIRFTCEADKARAYCHNALLNLQSELNGRGENAPLVVNGEIVNPVDLVKEAINVYFANGNSLKVDYNDFSLANIVYAGFAAANRNSLRAAASIMARALGIKDNVIINDDTSLLLGAITKSGRFIPDEGNIVSWNNKDDEIVDIYFTDPVTGEARKPVLCQEARNAISNADVIIASSGTQWSSLIPTYESEGFSEAIANSKAKIILVANRTPDKDAPGQSINDLMKMLVVEKKYFPENRINLVVDIDGDPQMTNVLDESKEFLQSITSFSSSKEDGGPQSAISSKHDPYALAQAVMYARFSPYLKSDHYVFDYDDTLAGRGNSFTAETRFNVNSISRYLTTPVSLIKNNLSSSHISICTGNSIDAVKMNVNQYETPEHAPSNEDTGVPVFADGGVNLYAVTTQKIVPLNKFINEDDLDRHAKSFIKCVFPDSLLSQAQKQWILDVLTKKLCIPAIKIEDRNSAIIAVKPIDSEYKPALLNYLHELQSQNKMSYDVKIEATGRTTIEFKRADISKKNTIQYLIDQLGHSNITYVGDEFFPGGNDNDIKLLDGVKCLHVKSPVETALFVSCLLVEKRIGNCFIKTLNTEFGVNND